MMPSRSFSDHARALATLTMCVCAVVLTLRILRQEPTRDPAPERFTKQTDWLEYASSGRLIGSPKARYVLVEFADYQCPACRRFEASLDAARDKLGADLAIVYRHLPLSYHKQARNAAIASECAGEQGRFEQMHKALFTLTDSVDTGNWTGLARVAGVTDSVRFEKCLADPQTARLALARDSVAAMKLGAKATPTLLIGGVRIRGGLTAEVLDSLLSRSVALPAVSLQGTFR